MNEVVQKAGLSSANIPNTNNIGQAEIDVATSLLSDVVAQARIHLDEHFKKYQEEIGPLLDEEVEKLIQKEEADRQNLIANAPTPDGSGA